MCNPSCPNHSPFTTTAYSNCCCCALQATEWQKTVWAFSWENTQAGDETGCESRFLQFICDISAIPIHWFTTETKGIVQCKASRVLCTLLPVLFPSPLTSPISHTGWSWGDRYVMEPWQRLSSLLVLGDQLAARSCPRSYVLYVSMCKLRFSKKSLCDLVVDRSPTSHRPVADQSLLKFLQIVFS